MARIGQLYLGGKNAEEQPLVLANSSIAFELDNVSTKNFVYNSDDGEWYIELKSGQKHIVARSFKIFSQKDILRIGFEQAQRALDILAFETSSFFTLSKPGESYVILYNNQSRIIVQNFGILNLSIGINMSYESRDKNGNIVPRPSESPSKWGAPLRFYRLSQTSNDICEAYRNLYLAFESLLAMLHKKKRNENETDWINRILSNILPTTYMSQVMASRTPDPIKDFTDEQYKIRCCLFHAKGEIVTTHEGTVSPVDVATAYDKLIDVWRHIAQNKLQVNVKPHGVFYNSGFELIMSPLSAGNLKCYYTEDNSSPTCQDNKVSPLGYPVFQFDTIKYLGPISPGRVAIFAEKELHQVKTPSLIHRICLEVESQLYAVSYLQDGLYVEGVDALENNFIIRLLNNALPKKHFSTVT